MPTYQYACPDCGHEFELRQKFTDEPVKRCPKCERRHVYRVINQVAVTFKGSGWYITDSKGSDIKKVQHKGEQPPAEKTGDTPSTPSPETSSSSSSSPSSPSSSPAKGEGASEAAGGSKSESKSGSKSESSSSSGRK
jgi:putative FmdB family regulatory protein